MALAAPPPSLISCKLQTEHQSFHRMLTIEVLMLFCALFIALLASCTSGYSIQNRQSGTYGYGSKALLITLLSSFSTRTIHLIRKIISKLSIPFITYTLTFSDDANNTASPFFILSAVFLHLLFDAIDTKSDKGILVNYNDLEERKHFPMQQITNVGWLIFILTASSAGQNIPLELRLPTCAVLGVRVVKAIVLYMVIRPASRSFAMGKNAKLVASYMDQLELEDSQSQLPPASELLECCSEAEFMSEYKYLVSGEEKQMIEPCQEKGYRITLTDHSELITLDKVWACEGVDHEEKGLCLSFALFKLLRRKLEGLPLAESGSPTALRLLLHHHGPFQDQERAFRIVQLQLAFVRDYLFSTLPLTCLGRHDFFPFLQSFLPTGYLILIAIVIHKLARPSSFLSTYYQSLINEQSTKNVKILFYLEGVLLLVVLLILSSIEAYEWLHNRVSNWGVVARLCQFVKHSQFNRLRPTVQLQTVGSSPSSVLHRILIINTNILNSLDKSIIVNNGLNQHSLLKWTWKRFLPEVPEQVKNAILRSLKDNNGRLSNGTGSLDRNGAGTREFHAACCLHSHTERILVWHIATSHCELHEANLQAASCLSRYCAYLVTRLPELIPEDSDWTKLTVGGVVEQVCRRNHDHSFHIGGWCFCWDCRTFRRKPHADEEEEDDDDDEGKSKRALQLVKMGEQLGELLRTEISDGLQRWKILADLWAEMFIYIAPSDNVEAYTKCLGNDGQFIIHVWALLSNIGINDRPPA